MSFDWADYLRIARHLASEHASEWPNEARHRCSVSRSYYAAFCSARDHLVDTGARRFFAKDRDVHQEVIEAFSQLNTKRDRLVVQNLMRLRRDRNKADYDQADWPAVEACAKSALGLCQDILIRLGPAPDTRQ